MSMRIQKGQKDVSSIIIETSLKLAETLSIEDSVLSSYLIGYSELNTGEAISQWLMDNWYFETTVTPNKYLFEITESLREQLKQGAIKIHMPWLLLD